MADISKELQLILTASNQTNAAFSSFNRDMNSLKDTAMKAAGAIAAAFAFKEVINSIDQTVQQVRDLQSVTGLTAQDASRLRFAGQALGVTTDELNISLGRLAKELFNTHQNTNAATDVFQKWGIASKTAGGAIRNINDVLVDAAEKIRIMGDSAGSRALELDLFGRSGGKLHELLLQGASGVRALMDESDALGLTLNGQTLDGMHNFTVQSNIFGAAIDGLKVTLGVAFLPILTAVVQGLTKMVSWIRSNILESKEFAGVVKALGAAFQSVATFIKQALDRIGAFFNDIKILGIDQAIKNLVGDLIKKLADQLPKIGEALDKLGPLGWVIKIALISAAVSMALGAAGMIFGGIFSVLKLALFPFALTAGTGAFPFVLAATAGITLGIIGFQVIDQVTAGGTKNPLTDVEFWRRALGLAGALGIGLTLSLGASPVLVLALAVATFLTLLPPVVTNGKSINDLVNEEYGKVKLPPGTTGGPIHGGTPGETGQDSPAATLDNVYADYMNRFGHQPAFETAKSIQNMGLSYNQLQNYLDSLKAGGMASGGIVTRPMRPLIGEAGPEAVIPLNKASGWGATNITINVSGNIANSEQELADKIGDRIIRELTFNRRVSY